MFEGDVLAVGWRRVVAVVLGWAAVVLPRKIHRGLLVAPHSLRALVPLVLWGSCCRVAGAGRADLSLRA